MAELGDKAQYTCVASNIAGKTTRQFNLAVNGTITSLIHILIIIIEFWYCSCCCCWYCYVAILYILSFFVLVKSWIQYLVKINKLVKTYVSVSYSLSGTNYHGRPPDSVSAQQQASSTWVYCKWSATASCNLEETWCYTGWKQPQVSSHVTSQWCVSN